MAATMPASVSITHVVPSIDVRTQTHRALGFVAASWLLTAFPRLASTLSSEFSLLFFFFFGPNPREEFDETRSDRTRRRLPSKLQANVSGEENDSKIAPVQRRERTRPFEEHESSTWSDHSTQEKNWLPYTDLCRQKRGRDKTGSEFQK